MNYVFLIWFRGTECPQTKSISEVCTRLNGGELCTFMKEVLDASGADGSQAAFSNVMPRMGKCWFLEKPAFITEALLNLSLSDHKYHRFMKYFPLDELDALYGGCFDFEKNAEICFGRYIRDERGERFEADERTGLYFLLRTNREFSKICLLELCRALEKKLVSFMLPAVFVSFEEAGAEWTGRIAAKGAAPVMALADFDTGDCRPEELEILLEDAQYTAVYNKNKTRIMLRCGAFFPHPTKILDKIVCLEMKV